HRLDRGHDPGGGLRLAEVVEHHRPGPDGANWIRDALPGDVRRGAVHRLEEARPGAVGGDVRARGQPHAALDGGADVGDYVAEQVGGDHDVEAGGLADHVGAGRVDQQAVELDVGEVGVDDVDDLVPHDEVVRARVRLRDARQPAAAAAGQAEGVADDALDAVAGEDVHLQADLVAHADVHAAAGAGVLALGVLAYAHHVDVGRPPPRQRRRHAGQEPDRADVQVEVEALPDRQQQPPQRDVVGHGRRADGAEVDRVVPGQRAQAVVRHERARAGVVIAAPGQVRPLEAARMGRLEHADALRDHLRADAVAADDRDAVRHRRMFAGSYDA